MEEDEEQNGQEQMNFGRAEAGQELDCHNCYVSLQGRPLDLREGDAG
jgi:hypothetical protein